MQALTKAIIPAISTEGTNKIAHFSFPLKEYLLAKECAAISFSRGSCLENPMDKRAW